MATNNNTFTFTQVRLAAIKPPQTGRDSYRDANTAGLNFVITANNAKSFYFVRRIDGKPTRLRIGAFPDITLDEARKIAARFTGEIANGENPHTNRKNKLAGATVAELFHHWFTTFAQLHKKTSQEDRRMFDKYCTALHKKELAQLTKADMAPADR